MKNLLCCRMRCGRRDDRLRCVKWNREIAKCERSEAIRYVKRQALYKA